MWTRNLDGFTVTVWDDAASMKAFRDTGAHGSVQPTWARFGHATSFAMWRIDNDARPGWGEVQHRLAEKGFWPDSPTLTSTQLRERFPVTQGRRIVAGPIPRLRRRVAVTAGESGGSGSAGVRKPRRPKPVPPHSSIELPED